MTTPISCAALLAGCLMLSACAGERATCVRKSTGETLHGTVMRYGDGSIREYDMADENGLVGAIDVTSSRYFKCKVAA